MLYNETGGKGMKKKFWIAIAAVAATIIGITITIFACGTGVNRDALIREAKATAEENLADYPYESLNITYNRTWVFDDVTYYYYKITVAFAEDVEEPYQTMWNVLTKLDSSSFQMDCYNEGDIVFQEYTTYQGNTYEIDSLDKYVLDCLEDYKFEYVTTTLKKIEVPYVGMSKDLINHTELGKPYDHEIQKQSYSGGIYKYYVYYFLSSDGKTKYTVKCKDNKVVSVTTSAVKKSSSGSSSSNKSDPYNASDYSNEEDFYYDHYDDFSDYEEAEDYYNKHKNG
jgi:hypothetical protein